MAITKIILQQMVTMDQNSITASKYPKYTVVLSNSISSITAGELTTAIESSKTSAAAAKQSEINAKQSELNAKDSENEAEISAASSQQSATQSASSATASANSAKAAKTSETNAKASETAAKTSETNANNSKTAAANSANAAKASETNAKTSETNAAASATKAENVASGMKASIGLGNSVRDCPDISGNPSAYIGFMRIREGVPGWPSIASGEAYLTGFISINDGSPSYTGIFQGWSSRSLYTYRWASNLGPQWTRHARKDEVSRFSHSSSERTVIFSSDDKSTGCYLQLDASGRWGYYSPADQNWKPLAIEQGGTGARDYNSALTNLNAMRDQKADLNGTDLNTLDGTRAGFYHQGANAGATSANHFPVTSAGALLVMQNNANGPQGGTQLYFPYNSINGSFYMRQYIKQSSTTGWEWTEWKIFQSYDWTSTPQFYALNLVRSSDANQVAGGILQCILNNGAGTQRTRLRLYPEFRGDNRGWATLHLQTGDKNQYLGMDEDGNVATNGKFIGSSAELRSNVSNPLTLTSQHPTIQFNETDRPANAPYYNFIFDGGNWRIQKDGDGYNGEYVIGYSYKNDQIDLPNVQAALLSVPKAKLQQTKDSLLIPNTGLSRWYDYNAPAGAEAKKYYPVIISHPAGWNGDAFVEVSMRTRSLSGSQEPNCNMIHMWIRDAGWSDMGQGAFGHYHCYDSGEVAILCVRGTDKAYYPHNAIYVRGDAFPIRLAATVGSTITIPTADWSPATASDAPVYKWGISDASDGIDGGLGIYGNLLDFTSGATGFYCSDTYRNKYGDSYQVVQANGIIQPPNGLGTYSDQDWNAQQSDGVNKFKAIAGNLNTPESSITYGGFHVGFSGTYATQFAGRNSKFFARSIEGGTVGEWLKLITATLAPKIPTDARDGFISDNAGDPSWAPSNGGGFQSSYAENRIMQSWIDGAGRLYSRFLTTNQPTTSKTDVPWKSAAMLELDNRFTGSNTFLGDILCSAANPLTLKSGNPTLSFVESDADNSTYMFVADGGGFRLNRDSTAGAELFNYSRTQNELKLGVSSYFTLNTRFEQGWTSKGSVDVTTTRYSGIAITTTAKGDATVGTRNLFEVSPDGALYVARRNNANNTGQWIINFPTAAGTLALSGTSDINYKTNIEEYDGIRSIENIKAMDLVTFVFKDDEKKRTRRGVIAQQIEEIDPTYVKHTYEPCGEPIVDDDGVVQGYTDTKERIVLDNNVLLLDALCAIKVLAQRDEEKTERINKLEKDVEDLKTVVEHLLTTMKNS
ncbi:L-shaped tail fiber protein [Escherichia phage Bf23]|uniref:L-shaped tail fiber protein n=1 Tax=Escherichia phage Bf23 TaxID=2932881 RepID=A0AAF0SQR2_BPBF2|nr:L-shaped tail fiber protein [Escherichia phage Bf23]